MVKWPAIIVTVVVVLALIFLFVSLTSSEPELVPPSVAQGADGPKQAYSVPIENPEAVVVGVSIFAGGIRPRVIEVPLGSSVELKIESTDGLDHGVAIPLYGIEQEVVFGEVSTVSFNATIAGDMRLIGTRIHGLTEPGEAIIRVTDQ